MKPSSRYYLPVGFRVRHRVRLFPGLRLNFSRSGISTSVGARGAWWTFGKRGIRSTFSLPGTGISYTDYKPYAKHTPPQTDSPAWVPWLVLALVIAAVHWLMTH